MVPSEGEHHPGIRSEGEKPSVPNTQDDKTHQGDGTLVSEDVDQDLCDWLSYGATDCTGEILDGEEERYYQEEAEYSRDTDGHQYAQGSIPRCVVSLLGQMSRSIIACDGVLSHQDPTHSYIRRRGANAPPWIACSIIEGSEDELGRLMSWCFG